MQIILTTARHVCDGWSILIKPFCDKFLAQYYTYAKHIHVYIYI